MQNILYQQTPPVNHTHFGCDVGEHFKNCVARRQSLTRLLTYTT